uniref:Secreted protein n=1 Tax=Setaria viridis TaxID=4556 RepID=A0A4U6U8D7_SETVI|nr:hypothetical protein SEVIR_5G010125v2 [Setaria viridis]
MVSVIVFARMLAEILRYIHLVSAAAMVTFTDCPDSTMSTSLNESVYSFSIILPHGSSTRFDMRVCVFLILF